MYTSVFRAVAAGILLYASVAAAQTPDKDDMRMINLFERDGSCFVVGWKPAPLDAPGKPMNEVIPFSALPQLKAVPAGSISRLEGVPYYAETFRRYPDLVKRQRQLDGPDPQRAFDGFTGATPLYQMFDQWLGARPPDVDYFEIDMDARKAKSRLGVLSLHPYSEPPMGVMRPYKQPRADLAKPVLLCIDGRYYSIYGDCQVAQHVHVKGFPDNLAALRYAGNPIYACSEELPPVLQSCGVDKEGVIWVADMEGHIAFFSTGASEFVRKWAVVEGARRVLIPRNNQSQSVFALDAEKGVFQEYHVEGGGKVNAPAAPRVLPSETKHILHCDADQVVFLTADRALTWVRNADDRKQSISLKLGKEETVWEGIYLAKTNQACLLVGPVPQALGKNAEYGVLEETRKSWDQMRFLLVPMVNAK